uniref:Phospholipase A-2-activating protein n=1 Tax=Chaetoceros debilis TaxID=122233 RepID=A0A7S3QBI1_9STRA
MLNDKKRYELSQSLVSDGESVRALACTDTTTTTTDCHLMSGSEGGILASISLNSSNGNGNGNDTATATATATVSIQPGGEGTRHGHQITALLASGNGNGNGNADGDADSSSIYVTGSKDKLIRIFHSTTHALIHTLEGHDNAVTSLSWLPCGDGGIGIGGHGWILISGSWDGTAKLWYIPHTVTVATSMDTALCRCIATLPGHENTVSVVGLPSDPSNSNITRLATGSAGIAQGNVISEHKIRLWEITLTPLTTLTPPNNNKSAPTASVQLKNTVGNDHNGPIRGVAYDALSSMLLSCSNDGTVKVRDAHSGEAIATLSFHTGGGQPPMLLHVASMGDGNVIACAEDGTVVVWNMVEMNQVGGGGGGGGGSSYKPQVIPHPNTVWKIIPLDKAYAGDFATACHDGMIRIFTTNSTRMASDADRAAFASAVEAAKAKSSTGPSAEEIAGLPKWEMNTTNPGKSEGQVMVFNKNRKAIAAQWSAASRAWIEVGEVTGRNENAGTIDGVQYDHVFPIEMDAAGGAVQKFQIGYNNGDNPFNTAQTFIDTHMLDQGFLSQIADYIQNRVGADAGPTLGAGAAGATSSASGPTPMDLDLEPSTSTTMTSSAKTYQHLPMKGYRKFETGADMKILAKVCGKIREFNSSAIDNNNLSPSEISSDGNVLDSLCQTIATTNRYHATSISDMELAIILKMMKDWSLEHVFPSIDLARLVSLHPDAAKSSRSAVWNSIIHAALDRCDAISANSSIQGAPKTAIPMLSFRLFANCFHGGMGTQSAVVDATNMTRILKCVDEYATSGNKNVRLALVTVLLNAASFMKASAPAGGYQYNSGTDNLPDLFLITVGNICGSGLYEAEAIARLVVALGTAVLIDGTWLAKAKALNMGSMLQHVADQHGEKARAIATEVRSILE